MGSKTQCPGDLSFDLIVIGGGPAGTAAAITAARRGLHVALLEASKGPRYRPGETLHPGIEPVLEQLGVRNSVDAQCPVRPEGLLVDGVFRPFGQDADGSPWLGYQMPREELDEILLAEARSLATVKRGVVPRGIRWRGHWEIATGDGHYTSPVVVGATGGTGWLPKRLGLGSIYSGPESFLAYGFGRQQEPLGEATFQSRPDGWCWTARVRDDLFSYCLLSFQKYPDIRNLTALKPEGKIARSRARWRVLEQPAASNYFVCGDSAFSVDPGSGKGVLRAMLTGILAADSTCHLLHSQLPKDLIIQRYKTFIQDFFNSESEALRERYQLTEPLN